MLCLALAPVLSACQAYRYPAANSLVDRAVVGQSKMTRPVIGVLEPEIALDDDELSADERLSTYKTRFGIERASSVIASLRDTGLFEEVDFLCQLKSAPNIAVEVDIMPDPPSDPDAGVANMYFMLISGGVIPFVETYQAGLSFHRWNRPDESVKFDWPEQQVVGWLATPLPLLPGWLGSRSPDLRTEYLTNHLVAKHERLFDPDTWLTPGETRRLTSGCS